ncbi:hypothetical protein HWV62_4161 [Athelia sp. TMB]|nr:hypothetical protein HWV62_4161 [Athelia sp. TMB]
MYESQPQENHFQGGRCRFKDGYDAVTAERDILLQEKTELRAKLYQMEEERDELRKKYNDLQFERQTRYSAVSDQTWVFDGVVLPNRRQTMRKRDPDSIHATPSVLSKRTFETIDAGHTEITSSIKRLRTKSDSLINVKDEASTDWEHPYPSSSRLSGSPSPAEHDNKSVIEQHIDDVAIFDNAHFETEDAINAVEETDEAFALSVYTGRIDTSAVPVSSYTARLF